MYQLLVLERDERGMGLRKYEKYEKYEPLGFISMLLALAVLGAALKIPGFSVVLPFALLPATVCAGVAAYFHYKLPKDKKCSPFSRAHPTPFFIALLLGNAVLFWMFFARLRLL